MERCQRKLTSAREEHLRCSTNLVVPWPCSQILDFVKILSAVEHSSLTENAQSEEIQKKTIREIRKEQRECERYNERETDKKKDKEGERERIKERNKERKR